MKEIDLVDLVEYLTVSDLSYITGFGKGTIRTMLNKNHHSYRPDFPSPIRHKRLGMLFNRDEIICYMNKYPKFFKKKDNLEISLQSPTSSRNYFNVEIHNPITETLLVFRISEREFELIQNHNFETLEGKVLLGRWLNNATKHLGGAIG